MYKSAGNLAGADSSGSGYEVSTRMTGRDFYTIVTDAKNNHRLEHIVLAAEGISREESGLPKDKVLAMMLRDSLSVHKCVPLIKSESRDDETGFYMQYIAPLETKTISMELTSKKSPAGENYSVVHVVRRNGEEIFRSAVTLDLDRYQKLLETLEGGNLYLPLGKLKSDGREKVDKPWLVSIKGDSVSALYYAPSTVVPVEEGENPDVTALLDAMDAKDTRSRIHVVKKDGDEQTQRSSAVDPTMIETSPRRPDVDPESAGLLFRHRLFTEALDQVLGRQ